MKRVLLLCGVLLAGGCSGARTAPATLQPLAAPDSLLRPGDVLRVTVWRQPDFSGEFLINPDSSVAHPLLQAVRVGGTSLALAKARVRDFLTTYEQNPRLVVEPLYQVTVAGEVRQPGLFALPRGTTLSQAVARAGGPSDRGRLDRVRLVRGGTTRVFNLLSEDRSVAVMPVASGDQLLVGRRSDFSFTRDVLSPVTSITAAVAALVVVFRNR